MADLTDPLAISWASFSFFIVRIYLRVCVRACARVRVHQGGQRRARARKALSASCGERKKSLQKLLTCLFVPLCLGLLSTQVLGNPISFSFLLKSEVKNERKNGEILPNVCKFDDKLLSAVLDSGPLRPWSLRQYVKSSFLIGDDYESLISNSISIFAKISMEVLTTKQE